MKQILIVTISIIISYLFNAYAYNSFNPVNYPTEAKFLTCFGVLILTLIRSVVYSEYVNDLENKLNKDR